MFPDRSFSSLHFFFHDSVTTDFYFLSLHDALPICRGAPIPACCAVRTRRRDRGPAPALLAASARNRSEEHTSELQSHHDLVCRLLLEKKNRKYSIPTILSLDFEVYVTIFYNVLICI